MDYRKRVSHSFQGLKDHVELFIPDIVLYFLVFVTSALYYQFSGLSELVKVMLEQGTFYNEFVLKVFSERLAELVISTALFVASTFLFGVIADVVKFDMMRELAENKKPSLKRSWKRKREHTFKYLSLKLIAYLFAFTLVILLLLLSYLLSFTGWSEALIAPLLLAVSLLAFFFFKLGILYAAPLLFLEKKNPGRAFLASLSFLFRRTKRVFQAGAVIFFFFVMFTLLEMTVGTVLGLMQDAFVSPSTLYLGFFMVSFVPFLVKLIYKIWAELFVFENLP